MAEKIKEQANDTDDLKNVLQRDIEGKIEEEIPEDILDEENIKKELEAEKLKSAKKQGVKNISLSGNQTSKAMGGGEIKKQAPRNINEELGIADELESEKNRDRKKTGADSSIKAVEPLPLDVSRGKIDEDNRREGEEEKSSGNKKVETGKEGEVSSNLKKEKKDSERKAKAEASGKGVGGKSAGAKVALDNFLKQAWLNVVTTFTLSMFWVYIHVFLGMIFPKFFCKLGQEWVPKEIKMTAPEQADKVARRIGAAEKGFTGCCCFIHFFLIIIGIVMLLLTPPVSAFIAAYLSWDFISSFFD